MKSKSTKSAGMELQQLYIYCENDYISLESGDITLLGEALESVCGTNTLRPFQLIDDSFLAVIESMTKAEGFTQERLYSFISIQKGKYCLLRVLPASSMEAFIIVQSDLGNYFKLVQLLNSGIGYEEAKKEAFKHYILDTDKLLTGSPEAGRPDCQCSRCGERIYVGSAVIRKWPKGKNAEYRYHPACLGMTDPGPNSWSFIGYHCLKCGHVQDNQGDCNKCNHWQMEELHKHDHH